MQVSVRRIRVRVLAVVVGALVTSTALIASPSSADEPLFVPWSELLPSFTTGYDPSSSNECVSGRDRASTPSSGRWSSACARSTTPATTTSCSA